MMVEQIKHFGPLVVVWLPEVSTSFEIHRIPKMLRRAKVVALLKPGKSPNDPKSSITFRVIGRLSRAFYGPISLLCHLFKLFKKLLDHLTPLLDSKLFDEQAEFRPGMTCCGQTLSLTQFLEEEFETNSITGLILVDITAAYDRYCKYSKTPTESRRFNQ